MEDIKHEKFKMAMFHSLPKQRPLYAVISTILEQSKEKKMPKEPPKNITE
jgi:hypothetical protein